MVFSIGLSFGDDAKWKSAIERALGTWESVVEWADYISFLARVQRVVKNDKHVDECQKSGEGCQLPCAAQISEILAMCLDPSLPAGVHQMCINVYKTVFEIMGPNNLSLTINVWLPGLLPVISWSAFNVKPLILQLFDKHIVTAVIDQPIELRELFKPIMLALLPSIEDESADCFTEIMGILNRLKNKNFNDDGEFFWRCFYLCILTSPESRMGALTYLHKNEPFMDESGFLVRAVCCGLEDGNVLVQRGFLDLLVKYLPLDSKVLQNHLNEFDKLILSACRTILRKDMSLNRRLRVWLLGPDPDSALVSNASAAIADGKMSRLEYVQKYAADRLVAVMLKELDNDPVSTCMMAQGLTDRWELGSVLAPKLLTPMLQCSRKMESVPKAFLTFFDNIECSVVWGTAIELLSSDPDAVVFMIENYDISDEEMLTLYIPLFVLYVLSTELNEIKSSIVASLLKILPKQELPTRPSTDVDFNIEVPKFMKESYERILNGEDPIDPPVSSKNVSWHLAKLSGDVVINGGSALLLNLVLKLIPETPGLTLEIPQSEKLITLLNANSDCGVELFSHLKPVMEPLQIVTYVDSFVSDVCHNILNNGYKQVEKVMELWQINEVCGGLTVSSALSRVLANKACSLFERAKIYVGIWSYSIDQPDIVSLLTKPTLLFLDIAFEDKALFGAYLQSGVVRTGTSHRFVKLLVDKIDHEANEDQEVLSYVLERFIIVLENPEIKSTYISKFAPLVSTLLLEWFDKNKLSNNAYTFALELAELTVLDKRIKDGKVWLRRFCDALINSYIEDTDKSEAVPVSLMKFITAATPLLEQKDDIRLFAEVCVRNLESEVDYEGYNQLLQSLLHASPMVEEGLLQCIVAKLNQFDAPMLDSSADGVGTNSGILHLLSAIESIIISGLKYVKENSTQQPQAVGGLTSAIASFHLESPEDRSIAVESEDMLNRCIQVAIQQSCKYWLFLQQNRDQSLNAHSSTTVVHTTGRLKTRLRKLMFICHSASPAETLKGVSVNISDSTKTVRMIHMFEGSRQKVTIEQLFSLALEDSVMFDVAATYIDSLENDHLSDIWQQVQSFLTASSQSGNNNINTLSLIVQVIVPRLDYLKLKNNRKYIKEFSETYVKLLLSPETIESNVLLQAIEKLPSVIPEHESQGQLLNKVLNAVFKNNKDVAKHAKLLCVVSETFNMAGTTPAKVWSRLFGDFLLETRSENEVVPLNLQQSVEMMPVVSRWVTCDKERVRDFVAKISNYGASNVLFGWSGTQGVADTNLRRLAYMTISTPPASLPVNLSKLTNQLSALWAQNAESVCYLLRACVLDQIPATLMSFMTFKLQAIFRNALKSKEPLPPKDTKVLVEACKVVDLALCMNKEQFLAFEWLFISDNGDIVYNREAVESDGTPARAGGVLEKLRGSPAIPQNVYQQLDTPSLPYRGKRRPLLPPHAQIKDIPAFLSRVSLAAYEGVYAVSEPDVEYCKEWILSDLSF